MQLGPKASAIQKGNEKGETQNLTISSSSLMYIKQIDLLMIYPVKSCICLLVVMRQGQLPRYSTASYFISFRKVYARAMLKNAHLYVAEPLSMIPRSRYMIALRS